MIYTYEHVRHVGIHIYYIYLTCIYYIFLKEQIHTYILFRQYQIVNEKPCISPGRIVDTWVHSDRCFHRVVHYRKSCPSPGLETISDLCQIDTLILY